MTLAICILCGRLSVAQDKPKTVAMIKDAPRITPMMSDEKMKMASEALTKDKEQRKGMLYSTMMRQSVNGKRTMKMGDIKKK